MSLAFEAKSTIALGLRALSLSALLTTLIVVEQESLSSIPNFTLPPNLNVKNPTNWAPFIEGEFRPTREEEY